MRAWIVGALLCAVTSVPAAADTEFVGELFYTGATGTCRWDPTGDFDRARLRPAMPGENDSAEFSIIDQDNARSYKMRKRNFGPALRYVQDMEIHVGFGQGDFGTRVAFTAQSPATITPTTDFVTVVGKIENFGNQDGCTFGFQMVLTRRVSN